MLKRPEAASLKQTGRFYLQVGFDEIFVLGQSGWCGAKYYPSDVIQKSVELGVAEITPTNMSRCIVKLDSKDARKKVERWQKISEVAAKQSGRDIIPKINNICNFKEITNQCEEYDAIILAYENEKENKLKNEIAKLKNLQKENLKIAIIIGPEGGIAKEEVEKAKESGIRVITLGNRILRTETVALNILSILMYELE